MVFISRRKHTRTYFEAPIRYSVAGDGQFQSSKITNYSKAGFNFISYQPISTGFRVNIVMPGYSPGTAGPEAYQFYSGEVKWCKRLFSSDGPLFGAGVLIVAKSHELPDIDFGQIHDICGLCGELKLKRELKRVSDYSYLCPHCHNHYHTLGDTSIRKSIDRFLIGNVI